jgi:hypothetical protein
VTIPTLTAATLPSSGSSVSLFSASNFLIANLSATKAPLMAAVRVPPSACRTSQSIQMVRDRIFLEIDRRAD